MKTWPRRALPFRAEFNRQFVAAAVDAISDGLAGLSRPYILPNTNVSQRGKSSVIECRGAFDVGDTEGDMVKHAFLDPHCRSIEEIMHASYEIS